MKFFCRNQLVYNVFQLTPEPVRRHVYFSGRVQGVGFRYIAARISGNYQVSGFVKNLPDGRVEMIIEGEPATIEKYLASLRMEMERYIRGEEHSEARATGEFESFLIRRDDPGET